MMYGVVNRQRKVQTNVLRVSRSFERLSGLVGGGSRRSVVWRCPLMGRCYVWFGCRCSDFRGKIPHGLSKPVLTFLSSPGVADRCRREDGRPALV